MTRPMEIPVIDLSGLNGGGEERSRTMAQLHEACKDWGFFWVENHGVEAALMDEVKRFVYRHYEDHLEGKFYASDVAKSLPADGNEPSDKVDWETTYFIQHHPKTNVGNFPEITTPTRETLDAYITQMVSLAERLGECMSLSLGLPGGHVAGTFAPPFVGTKFAMYPSCPRPELVWGLRAHTDAGGIILLLQDDAVGGLEFLKGGAEWVPVGPTEGGRLFVNIGDQVEVISGGAYRSVVHRVAAGNEGRRLSVATFYNPGPDAVVAPARETAAALEYPGSYRFGDYLEYYQGTKFGDKDARFQAVKKLLG
ncbi:1-aminocyclopropane-1-carboxylate oxidase 1 [Dichanthelium oligosanthes]|uniref:1-aminocyclopropane-1-carboxylate oxidase n=1 Tax=Dichanthelium oligosanthes TaxID=888268 RepID=A0A1E5VGC1_9POAL|nr:1-aminocyclopropane-1-carboxylate oxidase 1 [Dichanthelium oligosanthes]